MTFGRFLHGEPDVVDQLLNAAGAVSDAALAVLLNTVPVTVNGAAVTIDTAATGGDPDEAWVLLVIMAHAPAPGEVSSVMLAPSRLGNQRGRVGDLLMGPVLEAVSARLSPAGAPWLPGLVDNMQATGAVLVVKDDPSFGAYRVLSVAKGSADRLADAGRPADIVQLRLLLSELEA